jgi:riboflavin synthase
MFAGIVEQMVPVVSVTKTPGKTASIRLDLGRFAKGVKVGASVSVNGVCLTVTRKNRSVVVFDVIEETLRVTNLGELVRASRVNVERGLLLSDRIDGHLVSGHIDGTGRIARIKPMADSSVKVWIQAGPELQSMMIQKGSVAVDGISLTIVDVTKDSFSVCLIPRTLDKTTLGQKKVGDSVNIETDLIAKYLRSFVGHAAPPGKAQPQGPPYVCVCGKFSDNRDRAGHECLPNFQVYARGMPESKCYARSAASKDTSLPLDGCIPRDVPSSPRSARFRPVRGCGPPSVLLCDM